MTLPLVLVAAIADNGVIGHDNQLLWRLRSDLRRFREMTWGKPLIMGRKTFESIGKPLPGRQTIVLTRDPTFAAEGVEVARTWDEALDRARLIAERMGADAVVVAGGGEIYALALPHVQKLWLTEVHASPEGDTIFPAFDRSAFREVRRADHPRGPDDEHPFTFVELERRPGDAGH
jgi:dihydrofolate reductase